MAPIVDGLEERYDNQIVVKRINANEGDGPGIMQAYRIPGHPTTLIFDRNGNEVQRFIGPQPTEAVEDILLMVLENN